MKSEGDYFLAGKLWQTYTVCWKAETLSLPKKGPYSQGYGLPSGHAQLWELDHKDGRAPKNWCLRTVVLEKTPESPLDRKEIKLVNLKGNQSWILIGRTDAEAETPVFWSFDANSQLIGKVPKARKDWEQEKCVRGWDTWMAPLMQCTWTWANFRRWWGTGRWATVPGVTKSWIQQHFKIAASFHIHVTVTFLAA